ncbi:MAG: stearoyl-CoA desaturase (delta-9 desaturase) [Francisellaceae bacterium]|jgi:stearoyl-CoA desaturase (delta-9 desaturase)
MEVEYKEGSPVWRSILILFSTPIIAVTLLPWYGFTYGFSAGDWITFGAFMIGTGVAITAGYHRLWSHKAYKANFIVRLVLLFFGTASLQNSVIKWASDHRKHHRFVDDKEKDPYAFTRGFFFAHFGWLLRYAKPDVERIENVDDLKKDKLLVFQHKYYTPLAVFTCFIVPMLVGWAIGDIWGCLLLAGVLRLVLNHHFTFFINSLAHFVGKRPFSDKNTARDNALVSLVSYGEGYHNFHHKFAGDYRNGIHWYDFDPSKWLISSLSKIGFTRDLKLTPKPLIEAAQAKVQLAAAQERLDNQGNLVEWKEKVDLQYHQLIQSISAWTKAKQEWLLAKKEKLSHENIAQLKAKYKMFKRNWKLEKKIWARISSFTS